MSEQVSDDRSDKVALAATGLLSAVICVLLPPISRELTHLGRAGLAVVGLGLVAAAIWGLREPAARWARTGWRAVLVAACTLGIGNYFQFNPAAVVGLNDYADPAVYFLSAKYFDELGYDGLFGALIAADRGGHQSRTDRVRRVRDLSTGRIGTDRDAELLGRRLRDEVFTDARWLAFCEDSETLLEQIPTERLEDGMFLDLGYHPPPSWTLLAGVPMRAIPVDYTPTLTRVDTVLVAGMFGCVAWAFGADVAGLGLLWFLVTLSGRWPILGQVLMRFDWLAALVVGVCLLKKQRYATAGAALGYAACSRLFPVIFLVPIAAAGLAAWWRGTAWRGQGRTLGAAIAVGLVLVGGSAARYGPGAWKGALGHAQQQNHSLSSHRVGAGDALLFRGEWTREALVASGGIRAKEKGLAGIQLPLRAAGVLAMALVLARIWRSGLEDWELVGLAALPLFLVSNAQIPYWNLRLVLVLWHMTALTRAGDRRFHGLALAGLFAVEVASQGARAADVELYASTALTSVGLSLYFLGLCAWLVRGVWASRGPMAEGAPG